MNIFINYPHTIFNHSQFNEAAISQVHGANNEQESLMEGKINGFPSAPIGRARVVFAATVPCPLPA